MACKTTVVWAEGWIAVENVLSVIPESHVATWLVQVMPLLFFVGGFANARSLARHGGECLAFLRTRLVRLLTPTLAFMVKWLLVGITAAALPCPTRTWWSAPHVSVGLGLLGLVYLSARVLPGAVGASLLYLMLGAVGWSFGIGLLAINPATARLHVVMGSLGLCLLALSIASDRRHAERDSPRESATS